MVSSQPHICEGEHLQVRCLQNSQPCLEAHVEQETCAAVVWSHVVPSGKFLTS